MKQELFDVVDEQDQPTGRTTTKNVAHTQAIPHRVAAVFVFDESNNLLVQSHKFHGRLLDHSVGGHVAAGESYLEAAKREMQEELNITGVALKEVAAGFASSEHYDHGSHLLHYFGLYETTVPKGWQFSETDEVDQLIPMKVEEIVKLMNQHPEKFLIGFINTMKKYLETKGSSLKVITNP